MLIKNSTSTTSISIVNGMPEMLKDEAGGIVRECSYTDSTEPDVSGTIFRQRNQTALQYF